MAVLTSDDLVNVETGLVVRDGLGDRWRDVPVVLRVFDRELAVISRTHPGRGHPPAPAPASGYWSTRPGAEPGSRR